MAKAVVMPKAGITVESCIIGEWQKKVGDRVKVGDILFTYETDKASFDCESTEEGEILEIYYGDGEEVVCLVNVCAIGTKGDDCTSLRPEGTGAAAEEAPKAETPAAPAAEATKAEAPAAPAAATTGEGAISPRARMVAEHAGIDAAAATPTGPNGRIIERDVRTLMESGAAPKAGTAPAAAPAQTAAAEGEYEDVKFSGIRKAISRSMMQSLSTSAQLTNNASFDASAILAYRKALKAAGGDYAGITIGDVVLYAVSRTLLNYKDLNANMLDDNNIRLFKHVNLGVAVDTDRGLMVPTIKNADQKSLLEISNEVKELAAAARSGAISPDLLTGASFTVSNLGSFGIESFTPVINPPQTGILGVCTTTQRPRQGANGIELYPAMNLSLTYDHRAVDGGPASRFLKELCTNLEQFTLLLSK